MGEGWRSRTSGERRGANQPLPGGRGAERKPEQVRVLSASAGGGRGAAASPRADPRADQLGAAGQKLPWIRRELLDPHVPLPFQASLRERFPPGKVRNGSGAGSDSGVSGVRVSLHLFR